MKVKTFFSKRSIELLPMIYVWYEKNNKGIAIGWLFWSLEIRSN